MVTLPITTDRHSAFALRLTVVYGLVSFVGLLNHEMWRDELQAWMLARDSGSIAALIQNMTLEGHPALWHLCLLALTQLTHNPLAMQLFHFAVAALNVYLIAQFSPFTRLQKMLLAFGYYSLFEYGLISRSYALGVLFVFLFCTLCGGDRPPDRPSTRSPDRLRKNSARSVSAPVETAIAGCLLALLANTSVYGMLISAALLLALVWSRWGRWGPLGLAVGTTLAGWAACYWQIRRIRPDTDPLGDGLLEPISAGLRETAAKLSFTVASIWRGYIPLSTFWQGGVWQGNFPADMQGLPKLVGIGLGEILAAIASVLLVAAVIWLLRCQRQWLAVYLAGTGLQLMFTYGFFGGFVRHHGHLFILLVACWWLAEADRQAQPEFKLAEFSSIAHWRKRFFTALLTVQVAAGSVAYAFDLTQPFSASRDTAAFLRANQLDQLPLFGYRDREVSTLSGYLDQPIYYPNLGRFGSYWTVDTDDLADVEAQLQKFVADQGEPVAVVLTNPLQPASMPAPETITIEPLAQFPAKIARDESFYVYLASPQ